MSPFQLTPHNQNFMKYRFLFLLILPMACPLTLKAQPCALNVSAGSVTLSNTAVTYCSVNVSAGATLFIGGSVTLTVTGNVTIDGTVYGVGQGYGSAFDPRDLGPGAGTTGGGGGGHGGAGGASGGLASVPGGPANDNPANPVLMGSAGGWLVGGAWGSSAFPGGAAFLLSAPTGMVSINGVIDMSGLGGSAVAGYVGGGGAGGTISISAQTILFNGTLNANGGDGSLNGNGGGGGGLILVCPVNPLSGAGTYSLNGGAGSNSLPFGSPASPGQPGIYTVCPPPTPTLTATPTITSTPTVTSTPTATPIPPIDIFYISLNCFRPSQESVSIFVENNISPGAYALRIYNSAGEHIKTLDSQNLSGPITQSYSWNGTNKYNAACASGIYILDLIEPLSHKQKRILLIR
jgi:hypothetical protein